MKINTKYASPLILEDIVITEGSCKRAEGSLDDVELGIRVGRNIEKVSEHRYKITIELWVADEEGRLSVYVKGVARFKTEQENEGLIERNTIAIMFPYLRSYVSTLTTQPGMAPIVLPAMNIVAMLEKE